MASDNIFSGLKVVDFATFVAAPGAAVILSDFGADVIKVEPPSGDLWRHAHQFPPQPPATEAYPFHLANRNKRGSYPLSHLYGYFGLVRLTQLGRGPAWVKA